MPRAPPPSTKRRGRKRRWDFTSSEARVANFRRSAPRLRQGQRCNRLLLALAALTLGPHASAAVTELSWSSSSTFPSQATAVATRANGDVVVCGSWQSQGSSAPFVAKFSVSGAQQWRQQTLSEPVALGDCIAIDVDENADVYVVVSTLSDDQASTFAVLKLDAATGVLMWRRTFGTARDRDEPTSMRVADATVVVGGFLRASDDSDDTDGFVMRLRAATGELQWLHRVESTNGGDEHVFGVDVDAASSAVFAVGDSTGSVPSDDGDNSNIRSPLHGGNLFVQRIDADSGRLQWSTAIGAASTAELCRLSVVSVANSVVNANSLLPRRGNCAIAVSPDATHVFVTGSTVGGLLSTDASEQREFQRLCSPTETLACVQALVSRLDAASGAVAWLRQLVSRAGSTGERVAALEDSNGTDAVVLALVDAGFSRVDASEELAVLRVAGVSGASRWLVDAGSEGPDRALGLAVVSPPSDVLLLSASTRRRGSGEAVTSTLSKLNAETGDAVAFCRDVVAFAANATTVARPSGQTLVVVLPVLRVGSERCSGGDQAVGVTYITEDGSAIGGVDFVPSRGVVQFGGGSNLDQQTAVVAVSVLPTASESASVSFSVRLEASPDTTLLGDPAELLVIIEPPALVDKVQRVASDGAFWRRVTRWATLAVVGGLLLLLGLRVCCGRRLLLARERMAFEYKSFRLRRDEQKDGGEEDEDERTARARHRRWWRWRGRSARPSVGAVVAAAGVTRPPEAPEDRGDAVQDEAALRSHLESIQSLNESLEHLLLAPPPSPPSRLGPAAVTPAVSETRDKKRRGLRRLLRSPRTRRRSRGDTT